jgi:dephospho-CoA kinase
MSNKENDSNVKILAIVGMCGSGKSTAIDYLTERGIPKVYFGGIIYKAMAEAGVERSEDGESEKKFREEIRAKEGKDFVVKRAIKEAKDLIAAGQKRIILDGVYSWTEYNILRKEWPTEMTVIAVVVPKALRRKRLAERPDRPFDAQAAAERDRSEIENLEKGGPIAIADYYLDNSGTVSELHENFAKLLKDIEFFND